MKEQKGLSAHSRFRWVLGFYPHGVKWLMFRLYIGYPFGAIASVGYAFALFKYAPWISAICIAFSAVQIATIVGALKLTSWGYCMVLTTTVSYYVLLVAANFAPYLIQGEQQINLVSTVSSAVVTAIMATIFCALELKYFRNRWGLWHFDEIKDDLFKKE